MMMNMNIKWNADKYTSDFSFVHKHGLGVIELIEKQGGTAIDLGCGNGALTKVLHDKGFDVIGLDASDEMLKKAREKNPGLEFRKADATDIRLEKPVDLIFSNAVFHWIDREKHPQMLKCVYDALNFGGEFVFEFGGRGNARMIHTELAKVFAKHGYEYKTNYYFAGVGDYAPLVEQAGFTVRYAALFERPTELVGENGLEEWIRMFFQIPFSVIKDGAEADEIIAEAVDELKSELYINGKWYADYMRIRMRAEKPLR